MATSTERQEMIAGIRDLPAKVEAAVVDLAEAQLDAPGGEGEWTIRQVVHHLADAHLNAFVRMKMILTEENPILKPFDQEEWAKLPDTTRAPLQPSLAILRGLHARWASLLESVPESGWRRSGIHLEAGKVILEDLLASYAGHGEVHLRQIAAIRAANGW